MSEQEVKDKEKLQEEELAQEDADEVRLQDTSQIEREILLGYREFEISERELTVRVYKPTVGIDMESDSAYAAEFTKLLKSEDTPLTRRQMEKKLLKEGMWTEEDEEDLLEKQGAVSAHRLKLEEEKAKPRSSKKRLEEITLKLSKAQNESLSLGSEKQSYFANTIEGLAEERRWMTKIILCTKKLIGKEELPVWDGLDAFMQEDDPVLTRRVMFEATLYWQGVDASIFDVLPGLEAIIE